MLLVKTVLKYSPIHGLGCFADQDIPKGTTVWRFDQDIDLIFKETELEKFPESFREFLKIYAYSPMDEEEKKYILCIDHARHMNHSDDPNLLETPEGLNVASKNIKAGEELTCDYREFDKDFRNKLGMY